MKPGFILACFFVLIVLIGSSSALADYTLLGKIPAPQPCPGTCPVTGLASAGEFLFATVVYDTTSFIYLIRPSDGLVVDSYAWDIPIGGIDHPYFSGAAYAGGVIYWVCDTNDARFLSFEFDDASVYLHNNFHKDRIYAPTGLAWKDMGPLANFDALWVADSEVDSVFLMEETGTILEAYSLSDLPHEYSLIPTSVTEAGGNLFFTSGDFTDSLFESTQMAERLDAHYLAETGLIDLEAATFHDGLLYVAGFGDSILIYSPGSYTDPVPAGDSVIVHVIPDELDVGFTHVGESGSLYVDVSPTQACPPPGGVNFFGDFYEISTTAIFDYITKVALTNQGEFPPGVKAKNVRVFVRPSGECETWRDVTVEMLEIEDQRSPVLSRSGKRLSEDDEFSVFTFGEDMRRVTEVVTLKFDYLENAIVENEDTIPPADFAEMTDLLARARSAFMAKRYELAASRVDGIAEIAAETPEIPHTYDPEGDPGSNAAGRIISRAHTLAFSLRLMMWDDQLGEAPVPYRKQPPINIRGDEVGQVGLAPNPSGSEFVITFSAAGAYPVSVRVYSVEGRLVRTLADGDRLAGEHSVTWDGRNDQGMPAAAGTYFAVVREGEGAATQKLILRR
jgi:hypothetical protein